MRLANPHSPQSECAPQFVMFVTIDGIIPTTTSCCHCCAAWHMMLLILTTSSGLPSRAGWPAFLRSTPATLPHSWERNLLACKCAWKLVNAGLTPSNGQPSLVTARVLLLRRLVEVGQTAALLSTPPDLNSDPPNHTGRVAISRAKFCSSTSPGTC